MAADFGKRLGWAEARDGKRGSFPADTRDGRSVSPEKGRQCEDNRGSSGGYEYGRPDSRLGRQSPGSPGSSPEPEDNSSTSGDEGIVLVALVFPYSRHARFLFLQKEKKRRESRKLSSGIFFFFFCEFKIILTNAFVKFKFSFLNRRIIPSAERAKPTIFVFIKEKKEKRKWKMIIEIMRL